MLKALVQYKVILNYVIVKNYPLKRQRNSIYGVQMGGKPTGENYLKKKKKSDNNHSKKNREKKNSLNPYFPVENLQINHSFK